MPCRRTRNNHTTSGRSSSTTTTSCSASASTAPSGCTTPSGMTRGAEPTWAPRHGGDRGLLKQHHVRVQYPPTTVHAANAPHPLSRCTASCATRWAHSSSSSSPSWSARQRDRPTRKGTAVTERSVGGRQYGEFLVEVFNEWVRHDVGRVFVQLFDTALARWKRAPARTVRVRGNLRPGAGDGAQRRPVRLRPLCGAELRVGEHRRGGLGAWSPRRSSALRRRHKKARSPATAASATVRFTCHGECPRTASSQRPTASPASTTSVPASRPSSTRRRPCHAPHVRAAAGGQSALGDRVAGCRARRRSRTRGLDLMTERVQAGGTEHAKRNRRLRADTTPRWTCRAPIRPPVGGRAPPRQRAAAYPIGRGTDLPSLAADRAGSHRRLGWAVGRVAPVLVGGSNLALRAARRRLRRAGHLLHRLRARARARRLTPPWPRMRP